MEFCCLLYCMFLLFECLVIFEVILKFNFFLYNVLFVFNYYLCSSFFRVFDNYKFEGNDDWDFVFVCYVCIYIRKKGGNEGYGMLRKLMVIFIKWL